MPTLRENKEKICVCTEHIKKSSHSFDTYEELIKWAQEQIKKESINIGDDVKIIDEGKMCTSLGTEFFTNVFWASDDLIDEEKMFDIIRHYRYDLISIKYNGIKGVVIAEYDNKYIVRINAIANPWYDSEYIVIGKEGVKKVNA